MFRSNLHRGVVAVVFVAVVALGGASPAAAEGPVWREAWDWINRLWSGATLQPSFEAAGDCGPEIDPDGKPRPCPLPPSTAPDEDCGPEIDPNGGCGG